MRDRMPPEMLARAKAPGQRAKRASDLATQALSGDSSAEGKLIQEFGRKEAVKIVETELQRNGARPKGLLARLRAR